jgi:putative endonuclease
VIYSSPSAIIDARPLLKYRVIARAGGRSSIPEASDGSTQLLRYILASRIGGTLYTGVTNDLIVRVAQHKAKLIESFTEKYDVARLVYFEQFDDPENDIRREKRLKKWNRAWKIRLIEERNPSWNDLYPEIAGN